MFNPLDIPTFRIPRKEAWPKGSYVRSKFGQKVLWLDKSSGGYHLSAEVLEKYRLLGDGPVDRILELLENDGRRLGAGDDLLLMAENALEAKSTSQSIIEQEMASFLETHQRLPEWVDLDQIKRGQEVHLAYLPVVSLTLYYRSLIAGFSIPKIAEVIQATAYLAPPSRPDQALQRLLDTGEFVVACTALGVDALLPGGIGWKTALHVRVLHAKVRFAILKKKGTKRWNVDKFGIPINQEDMAATLLAFSTNVLVGIELISGVSVSEQERLDYLALWRYIGWLLGVETEYDNRCKGQPTMSELPPLDPCGPGVGVKPNPTLHSRAILQSIIFHLLDPDESSVKIAHHLLKVTDRRGPGSMRPEKIPEDFYKNGLYYYRCFNCRRMIGDPLADALLLPLHPNRLVRINIYLMSTFSLTLMRIYSKAARWIAPVRRWMVRWHSNLSISFHERWMKTHKTKMARALAKNEKSSVLEVVEEDANNTESRSISLCPFAMTAEPE